MYTFFPLFVLLQYQYLDIVLNATQQDLIVSPFQVVSNNPKLRTPSTPSLSPLLATCLFSKSMIFFSAEMFICAVYYTPVTSDMVFVFLTNFTQYESLSFHPCCCKWHYVVLFCGLVLFHCVYIHLLNPIICWWTFGLFPCLGYCD